MEDVKGDMCIHTLHTVIRLRRTRVPVHNIMGAPK